MHRTLCVCALIPVPQIDTRTRLVLVMHRYEERKTTNSGQLAVQCLANSQVIVRGHENAPSEALSYDANTTLPVLLFPHEDAVPLTDLATSSKSVTLVVPDGTWRQAAKVRKRVPGMSELFCVSLPQTDPTTYRLRYEAHSTGLATLEAIARAMEILEGAHVRVALERVFRAMVERTLWARGLVDASEVEGGIPEGVERHNPSGS